MAQTILVPRCKQCGKVRNSDNLVATSALRMLEIKEEPVQIETDTSSVQVVAVSSEAPTSQDTPSVDDTASRFETVLDETPEEPDYIKDEYEPSNQEQSSASGTSSEYTTSATPEDETTFRKVIMRAKVLGLDNQYETSPFTYRELLNDLHRVIRAKEPVSTQRLEWARGEMTKVLSTPFTSFQVERRH